MDRIVIVRDDERVLDVESSVYLVIAVDPANSTVWTRQNVVAMGGLQRALFDPMQLAARAFLNAQEIKNAVKEAVGNAGLDYDVDKLTLEMCRVILEREAEEKANAQ